MAYIVTVTEDGVHYEKRNIQNKKKNVTSENERSDMVDE